MNNIRIDADVLAARFTLKELRKELHSAEMNCLPDQDDYGYWFWYQDTVKQAIVIKQRTQPKQILKPGHIDIAALRDRADIVTIMETYGIKLKKTGHNFKASCPFHKEKTPSFTIYPIENRWHCFGCQADGDIFSFVQKIEGISFLEAASKVGTF